MICEVTLIYFRVVKFHSAVGIYKAWHKSFALYVIVISEPMAVVFSLRIFVNFRYSTYSKIGFNNAVGPPFFTPQHYKHVAYVGFVLFDFFYFSVFIFKEQFASTSSVYIPLAVPRAVASKAAVAYD